MSNKLMVVTDIPTPYRIHFFNRLHDALKNQRIDFEVLFMARTVAIRFWNFDAATCLFPFKIVAGIHPRAGSNWFHFNPGILWSVIRERPHWLLLGGAWHMPTIVSLLVMARLYDNQVHSILWAEANDRSMVHKTGWISRIRTALARMACAYAVPGKVAEDTLRDYWQVTTQRFLRLPNIVNEHLFRDKVQSLRQKRGQLRDVAGLNSNERVLLWPARLHEGTKGIINFLGAVREGLPANIRILIAGEGPDRKVIEEWLAVAPLPQVTLLGQCSEEHMLELYAVADALLLPSLRDPNPLSVVEGLWSGLPLLVSGNCGNWPEALEQGGNGWLIDTSSPQSMQQCVAAVTNTSTEQLRKFGGRSLQIAEERFSTTGCVARFIRELTSLQ